MSPAITHPVTMNAKATATIHSSRVSRPMRAQGVACGLRRIRGLGHAGWKQFVEDERKQGDHRQYRNRRRNDPRAEVDLHTIVLCQRDRDWIAGGGGEPEG